jgi:hypothetical protein
MEELLSLPIVDVESAEFTFKDIFNKEIMVVALLRHFG